MTGIGYQNNIYREERKVKDMLSNTVALVSYRSRWTPTQKFSLEVKIDANTDTHTHPTPYTPEGMRKFTACIIDIPEENKAGSSNRSQSI